MQRATNRVACIALAAAGLAVCAARADLYSWIDASGRVQYSDHPPKDFKGPVKKLEVDDATVLPLAPQKAPAPPAAASGKPVVAPSGKSEIAAKRRAERERLQASLDAAREKLAAARKALADGQDPQSGEQQIVQRPAADPKASPMPGLVPSSARSNCRVVERDGKKIGLCPVSMPSEGYFERVAGLERAVKDAEEEVAVAERAYRRGVD